MRRLKTNLPPQNTSRRQNAPDIQIAGKNTGCIYNVGLIKIMDLKCINCGMVISEKLSLRTNGLCIKCFRNKKTCITCGQSFVSESASSCPACVASKKQEEQERITLKLKRKREQELAVYKNDAQVALNTYRSWAEKLITPHLPTLAKKKRRMIRYDDYGLPCSEKWEKEVEYFYERVLSVNADFLNLEIASRKANECLYEYKLYLEDPKDALVHYLNALVDSEIKNSENTTPEYSNDITPEDYEHFCADILNENGWVAIVTQGSGDQGIDVIAEKNDFRLAIQCKKYSKPVGNKAVQEAYSGGAFYEANACAVVATIEYTPSAIELADSLGVHLFHHDDLAGLTVTSPDE